MAKQKGDMYELWFSEIVSIPDRKKRKIRLQVESAEEIYYIEEKRLMEMVLLTDKELQTFRKERLEKKPDEEYDKLRERKIRFFTEKSSEYPQKLRNIQSPPYAIYVSGELPKEEIPAVAIVGARDCSKYGENMAVHFAQKLAESGIQIISGMARGIDGLGQRGALNAGGKSYAVLGCGVDVCYPRENRGLFSDLKEKGGILSEYPPGCPPVKTHFPARNRIISALADVVLVIEARQRSGSLITADMALNQGKDVYALPGLVTSNLSRGCHELIRQGAGILISPEDFMKEMGWFLRKEKSSLEDNKKEIKLERTENMLYSCLGLYPKDIDTILTETSIEPKELTRCLITMEMKGYIKEVSKNYYIRT